LLAQEKARLQGIEDHDRQFQRAQEALDREARRVQKKEDESKRQTELDQKPMDVDGDLTESGAADSIASKYGHKFWPGKDVGGTEP